MLALILLYFIGKKFYELADKFEKSKWGYAVAGIAIYYAGAIGIGTIIVIILEYFELFNVDSVSDNLLGILIAPFGFISCYVLYIMLEKKWEKEKPQLDNIIEEIGNKE
ncbi:hypothetical protein [Tenacibaculum sp. 190524A05c]|uniref:hypothetical protein n=1 Tax=Tenacibaculum platacis TaxID=3137852 RepID=UPI0032B2295B